MQYSENLHMNLPQDSDPLEVSKLSENFEILDTRLGTGTQAIVSSMAVGDITYSTRNLEEESGGVLIACDQRTIDLDAYPDLPRDALYWPYPELVFTDESAAESPNYIAKPEGFRGAGDDISTEEYIYTFAQYTTAGIRPYIYSIKDKTITAIVNNGPSQDYSLFRIANGLIAQRTGRFSVYNDDLTRATSPLDSSVTTLLASSTNSIIAKIGDNRFFIVSFMSNSSPYPTGFYKTDDGFLTVQNILNIGDLSGININLFKIFGSVLINKTYYKSPFYQIKKKKNGEVIVLPTGSATDAEYNAQSENGTRSNIDKIIPRIWETADGLTTISSRRLGGNNLEDWIFTKISEYGQKAIVETIFPVEGEYYVIHIRFGSTANKNCYVVTVNIETSEVFSSISERSIQNMMSINSQDSLNTIIYDKFRKKVIYYNTTSSLSFGRSVLYLENGTFDENIPINEIFYNRFNSNYIANYMDSAIAVMFAESGNVTMMPKDKRLFEHGVIWTSTTMLMLIDKDIDASEDFMKMYLSPYVAQNVQFINNSGVVFYSNISQSNLVEINGDIYWPNMTSLYKIPKNKRQMPYIKNAYMKVLNDPEEGGAG